MTDSDRTYRDSCEALEARCASLRESGLSRLESYLRAVREAWGRQESTVEADSEDSDPRCDEALKRMEELGL